jgi:phytoene synthase
VSVGAVVQLAAGAINRRSINHDKALHQSLTTNLEPCQPEKR